MLLPNLSGLHLTTRTGDAASYLAKLDAVATSIVDIKHVLTEVFGKAFVKSLKTLAGTHGVTIENYVNIRFGYTFIENVKRDIVLSEEFLSACLAHFADPNIQELSALSYSQLMNTWREKLSETIETFYKFPTLEYIVDGLRGMMATDVVYMKDTIDPNEPPRSYITEVLGQPFYFRAFMKAFDEMFPLWKGGDVFKGSFEQFATTSFEALGWSGNPHTEFVPIACYGTNDSYNLTLTDRTELRNRFAYDGMTLCYAKNATEYYARWKDFVKTKVLPANTLGDPELTPTGAWCVYIQRTALERTKLLERLEKMWKTYVSTQSLRDLVDLIQTFNGNHYFRDGNGRFSMFMIQLHMYAKEGKLVYFWNHNPNGPCLSKYVSMINLTPRIPTKESPRPFDKEAIKTAFETALETTCHREDPLPNLLIDEGENPIVGRKRLVCGLDGECEYSQKMQRIGAQFAM